MLTFLLNSAEIQFVNRPWKNILLNNISVLSKITVLLRREKLFYLSV